MSPLEFMQRLAALVPALVPRRRLHLIRFHGVLAPNAKLRPLVVPQGPEVQEQASEVAGAGECEVETGQARAHRISWAQLLKHVFDIDMQHCPNCGAGELKIIAAILERPVIEKILTHLGLDPQPPPRGRAREAGQRFAALPPEPRRHKHPSQTPVTNTTPQAATPNRSRGDVARRVSAVRSEFGSTPRTWSPASLVSAEEPAEAALRGVTVAKSKHLIPPLDRQRSPSTDLEGV
jgi:hypothetical protein